jgi:hypothetical protein
MANYNRKWTDEMLFEVAATFSTRKKFAVSNGGAYKTAVSRGILDEVCVHMEQQHIKWTDEMLFDAVTDYTTRHDFKKGNRKAYDVAHHRGILNQVCANMELQHTKWTDEILAATAAEFGTRVDFLKANRKAYQMASHRGILDQVCVHMERGIGGFNPNIPGQVYIVSLESPVQSYIGFGISNDHKQRIKDHIRTANREGFSLTTIKVINFEIGKDSANLELKLKRNLPIVDTGLVGFKTEAILALDHNKLEGMLHDSYI